VHAVEAAQEGRLAAARRADQGRDLVSFDREIDALQGLKVTIVEIQRIDLRLQFGLRFRGRVLRVLTMAFLVFP
jgi:hypothetical protein